MEEILTNPLVFGIAADVLTCVAMVPQLFKIAKKKRAEDVSTGMLVVLIIGGLTWVYYGILKKDVPIIITNSFSVLVNIAILSLSIKYKKQKEGQHTLIR